MTNMTPATNILHKIMRSIPHDHELYVCISFNDIFMSFKVNDIISSVGGNTKLVFKVDDKTVFFQKPKDFQTVFEETLKRFLEEQCN